MKLKKKKLHLRNRKNSVMWKSAFTNETNKFPKDKTVSQSKGLCNYPTISQLNLWITFILFNKTCSILDSKILFQII